MITNQSFITQLYTFSSGTLTPLPYFIIEEQDYDYLKETADVASGLYPIVDEDISDGIRADTIGIRDDKVMFVQGNGQEIELKVNRGYVPKHSAIRNYSKEDFVEVSDELYVRKEAGRSAWGVDEWVKLKSGHKVSEIFYYDARTQSTVGKQATGIVVIAEDTRFFNRVIVPGDSILIDFAHELQNFSLQVAANGSVEFTIADSIDIEAMEINEDGELVFEHALASSDTANVYVDDDGYLIVEE
ncbi:hypothetical protein [Vibrio phage vB_VmeM-Yong XC32]|nr:hypothetical protein [Vibrio phage vB_VmeM-Yong XC31]QAX96513.1 hypothetical protein [Vibrio phage vB_VmeM-Yong XC32]QAX96830.1 hypothetical protein [Vibrio phage vB_VmeM-Yong MS31]